MTDISTAEPTTAESTEPAWVRAVLHFWFQELSGAQWFAKDAALDARIRERFLAIHEHLVANDGAGVSDSRTMLAAVIVLDQFSRNLFRGDPRAFAADPIARRIAANAIDRGFDKCMGKEERMFLYMPFQHSEELADQDRSMLLFTALGDAYQLGYAKKHHEVIARFGRFPHRNKMLGRAPRADEIAAGEVVPW